MGCKITPLCYAIPSRYRVLGTQYRVRWNRVLSTFPPQHHLSEIISMAGVRRFTDLLHWQKSREWSKTIFAHTRTNPFHSDRRLVAQINDSSESVMANIAEGFGRGTQGEFVQFLGYALGSLNETQAHLTATYDREYLAKDDFGQLFQQGTGIRKMVVVFVQRMVKPGSGVTNIRKPIDWNERTWQRYEQITGRQRPELFRKPVLADDEE